MLSNYLKTTLRTLWREKANTSINIAGLTLGITGSIVLFLIVKNAASYDTYHHNFDRIYRIVTQSRGNHGLQFTQGIPAALPEAIKNDFPQIEESIITSYRRGTLITIIQPDGLTRKYEEASGLAFTQPAFFKIFDRKMETGFGEVALGIPHAAIISKKWALKYFGRKDVTGQILKYEEKEYVINGVMEDTPSNTDLPFELLLSYVTIQKEMDEKGWGSVSDTENCFILAKPDASLADMEAQMPAFVKKYLGDDDGKENKNSYLFQPLRTLHSDMRFGNYNKKLPKEAQIVFSVIAVFLLLTACINFINLTTAEAIKRIREVGIRKILGSSRKQLIFQFLGEALVVTVVATIISLAVAQLMLEFINPFMNLTLFLNLNSDYVLWAFIGLLIVVVTLFAGVYPAWMVSSFTPVLALKNQLSSRSMSGSSMRKGLVVVQFFISQFFIIATIVIVRQMDFIQKQNIGFAREAIITVPIPPQGTTSRDVHASTLHTLKNQILSLPGVEKASLSFAPPSYKAVIGTTFSMSGKSDTYDTQVKQVDGDYLDLYAIPLVAGEPLTDQDSLSGLVVNEKLARIAGYNQSDEIVGKEMAFWGKKYQVKGVVRDFNTMSLNQPIEPVVLFNDIGGYRSISIKINPAHMQETIGKVQIAWEALFPEYIFNYDFVDEQVRSLYNGERRTFVVLSIFSSIAIFIGCLGLFGLVTFMANQKTKEIGIRKVLGASVESILTIFSKEFAKLLLMGFALAAPPAWFLMSKLLQQFAYKITLGPMIFLISLAITFLIAMFTVGFRSLKASLANPVRSLRSE